MTFTDTALFLTPALSLKAPINLYGDYYEGTFKGDVHHETYKEWESPYILMVYNDKLPTALATYLSTHPQFVEQYSPRKGHMTFVFKVSDQDQAGVVRPFLEGKYSKVDRKYVDRNFPDEPGHRLYGNGLVFRKSPAKKSFWETKLDTTLPPDAEVWSKPQKKKEVYGYIKDSDANSGTSDTTAAEMDHNQISDQDLREALA